MTEARRALDHGGLRPQGLDEWTQIGGCLPGSPVSDILISWRGGHVPGSALLPPSTKHRPGTLCIYCRSRRHHPRPVHHFPASLCPAFVTYTLCLGSFPLHFICLNPLEPS